MKAIIGYLKKTNTDEEQSYHYSPQSCEFKKQLNRWDNESEWTKIVYFEVEEDNE